MVAWHKKLAVQSTIYLSSLVVIPLLVGVVVILWLAWGQLLTDQSNKLMLLSEIRVRYIEIGVKAHLSRLESLASLSSVRDKVVEYDTGPDEKTKKRAQEQMVQILNELPTSQWSTFERTYIVEPIAGKIVASSDALMIGKKFWDQTLFFVGLNRAFVGEVVQRPGEEPTVVIGVPIKEGSRQRVMGVLLAEVSMTEIFDLVNDQTGLGTTGKVYVVDKAGKVISASAVRDQSLLGSLVNNPAVKQVLAGGNGIVEYQDNTRNKVGVYRWLNDYGWGLLIEQERGEVYGQAVVIVAVMMTLLGLQSLSVGGFVYLFIYKRVLRPVEELGEAVTEMTEGKLAARVKLAHDDELGELANGFNLMVQQLQNSYTQMENTVEERTQQLNHKINELESLNRLMVGRELKMVELKKQLQRLRLVTRTGDKSDQT